MLHGRLCTFCNARYLLLAFVVMTAAAHAEILGKKPAHIGSVASVPNEAAITRKIWAPGIDDGYVPQGLSYADGHLYLATYRSTDTKVGSGPCRLYKVNAETGVTVGHFDLPADCGHAGGAAYLGKGTMVVADTRKLYKLNLARAFAPPSTTSASQGEALISSIALRGELKGSFADFDGKHLFIGTYDKDAAKSKAHFISPDLFDAPGNKPVGEAAALRTIPLPAAVQGAAFDRTGQLWVTASGSKFGTLMKLDPKTGAVLAQYEMVIGVEDLAFDDDGQLWSVSEAGSLRWRNWGKSFPVLFRMDIGRLVSSTPAAPVKP